MTCGGSDLKATGDYCPNKKGRQVELGLRGKDGWKWRGGGGVRVR